MRRRLGAAAAFLFILSAGTQAASARQAQQFLPDGGPPVINGLYEKQEEACSRDCKDLLALGPIALREGPHPDAPVVATTAEREWLAWVGGVYRFRPMRGVVEKAVDFEAESGKTIHLKAGDSVYLIDDGAQGGDDLPTLGLWIRGERFWYDSIDFSQASPELGDDAGEELAINWQFPTDEQREADQAAGAGWWVEVQRDNGQRGFVLRYDLDCGWDGKGDSDECFGGRDGPAPAPPRDCPPEDIAWECQDARRTAEPSFVVYPQPQPFRDCGDCPSMVWIPDQPFAIGQYEVTFAEWDACVAGGGCAGARPDDLGWGRGNMPVMGVRWADAQAYVRWLSAHTGQRYRLPTTGEWVVAAFPGGRRQNYSWGNEDPVCDPGAHNGAAYNACLPQRTRPVGTFQPNAFGLHDTIGNVGEWLQDPYAPGDGRMAIIGSSWASGLGTLGGRGGGWEHDLGPDTGFRVLRER